MKVFVASCIFGLAIACAGCVTNNWSKNLLGSNTSSKELRQENWIKRTIGKGQASDARARDIEQRLGYSRELGYK